MTTKKEQFLYEGYTFETKKKWQAERERLRKIEFGSTEKYTKG